MFFASALAALVTLAGCDHEKPPEPTFQLSLTTEGEGSATRVPDKTEYAYGDEVELTAHPGQWHRFAEWSGDIEGPENPKTIVMDGHKTVIATFEPDQLDEDYFVSATRGDDGNRGTMSSPYRTIQRAIEEASNAGGNVHVAEGTYRESLSLSSRVNLYGGYADDFVTRKPGTHVTSVESDLPVAGVGVNSATIHGFRIVARDVQPQDSRRSAIAIHLHDCLDVTISSNDIVAGSVHRQGADGGNGLPGANGAAGGSGVGGADGGAGGAGGWSPAVGRGGGEGGSGELGTDPGKSGSAGGLDGQGGGDGGAGGGGGGGGGGPSVGVVVGTGSSAYDSANTFTLGQAGSGGLNHAGAQAPSGEVAQVKRL